MAETERLRAIQRPALLYRIKETGIESKKLRLVRGLMQKEEYDSDEEDSSGRQKNHAGRNRRKVVRKARSRIKECWEEQIDREKRKKEELERLKWGCQERGEERQKEEVYDLQWVQKN